MTNSRNPALTRKRLLQAVGEILAERGFKGIGINAVARQAGVDKVLIYRYFDNMQGLIKAFGQDEDFWPSIEELCGTDAEIYHQLPLEDKLISLLRNYITGIRNRPITQEIMAWEMIESNEMTQELAAIRETRMLQFAEIFLDTKDKTTDLTPMISVIGAGISYLICRSRHIRWYNGLDLDQQKEWKRIEKAIEAIVRSVIQQT